MNSGEPLRTIPNRLPPSTGGPHLRDQVHQEQHRPVGDPRQAGSEAAIEALLLVLLADLLLDLLPLDAERRVGEHVVEALAVEAVVREGVAEDDVVHVLALDEHVGLADGVGLGVQLLPEHDRAARLGLVLGRYSSATESMPPVPAVGS